MLFNTHIFTLLLAVITFSIGTVALVIFTAWAMVLITLAQRFKAFNAPSATAAWARADEPRALYSYED